MRDWSNDELIELLELGGQIQFMDADALESMFSDRNIVEIIQQACNKGLFKRKRLTVDYIRDCVTAINDAKALLGTNRIDFGKSVTERGYILSMNSGPYGNFLPVIRCGTKERIWYNLVSMKYVTCKDLLYNLRDSLKLRDVQVKDSDSYNDCQKDINNYRNAINRLDSVFLDLKDKTVDCVFV